ncbi:MAG: dienelactone hydrolase family protein [Acidobacteriia bacterium]|nr:dienelactone hydrolase family protein [Terriglobia bacterium]
MVSDGEAGEGGSGVGTLVEPVEISGMRGYLHRPVGDAIGGLVLTHGAGSDCNAELLVAAARELARLGWMVLRCNLAYRQQRPTGPPRSSDARRNRDGLRLALQSVRADYRGSVYLGGHSYGGRQASILAAEEAGVADALLLLSYPLHPPRKPEQLRTEHWPELRTPVFFVHGDRDSFGRVEEMREWVERIPARRHLEVMEGAAHDLKAGRDLGFCERFVAFCGK